ncbi:MAG: hypothetical protein WBC44_18580 [Planctomycetaceae bacterium]
MGNSAAKTDAAGTGLMGEILRLIKAVCPKCHRKYRLDERYAGRSLKCRSCGEKVDVPGHVEISRRPVEKGPGIVELLMKKLVAFLTGRSGKERISRSRWLSTGQAQLALKAAIIAVAVGAIVGFYLYWGTDAAKIQFGRAESKEIVFRQIVELEEELAGTLAGVRSKTDAASAAGQIESIVARQNGLWETLVEWKTDEFLTPGETNLLRTRFRDRYETATAKIAAERLRVAKIAGANQPVLEALDGRSGEASVARRLVLGAGTF